MPSFAELQLYEPVLALAIVAVAAFGIRRSYLRMVSDGRPIRPAAPDNALFAETDAWGWSETAASKRVGGASSALLVWVTSEEVVITPPFPINIFFAYFRGNDLDQRVPHGAITSLDRRDSRTVGISFRDKDQASHTLILRLRNADAFVRATQARTT